MKLKSKYPGNIEIKLGRFPRKPQLHMARFIFIWRESLCLLEVSQWEQVQGPLSIRSLSVEAGPRPVPSFLRLIEVCTAVIREILMR